jgi:glycosyltransferase involved in cell wall biosynthesis
LEYRDGITLLVPIKNGEHYLDSFLKTLDSQCTDLDEILVINDHSVDRTCEILEMWSQKSANHIRILTNCGQGLVDALNFGISQANKAWIARYDCDDFYATNRLEVQRRAIADGVVAVFCDYEITFAIFAIA